MSSILREAESPASNNILVLALSILITSCCITALADDSAISSAMEVVTLDVKDMT
jgi:hypothetical protein